MELLYNPLVVRTLMLCVLFGLLVMAAVLSGRREKHPSADHGGKIAPDRNGQSPVVPDSLLRAANRGRTGANDADASPPGPHKHAA